jgi:phenylacetate-coenzyme A ligase PaaK-like adenylate-forming protein
MIYRWGKKINSPFTPKDLNAIYDEAKLKSIDFSQIPILDILDILDNVGREWEVNGTNFNRSFKELQKEISFSPQMIKKALSIVPILLNRENLRARLEGEFQSLSFLDQKHQTERFLGEMQITPYGITTHVTAGNVFLGFLDSLLMGLITKNVSIIKLSSNNSIFPDLFMKSLIKVDKKHILTSKFSLVSWKGGDHSFEKIMKEKSDLILAWGGEEMLHSLKIDLPSSTKLIDFGPKVSIQLISVKGLKTYPIEKVAENIANDVMLWDQSACSSPQNLFIEKGIDVHDLMENLKNAFRNIKTSRGKVSAEEEVELLKEVHRGIVNEALGSGMIKKEQDFILHYEKSRGLRNSPLNRTLILKTYTSQKDLIEQLAPYQFYLQSVSLLIHPSEDKKFQEIIEAIRAKRVAPLGTIMQGTFGAPHDHRFALNEMVRFTPWEMTHTLFDLAIKAVESVPFYRKKINTNPQSFEDIPLLDSQELSSFKPPIKFDGHIFASGGSTGKPKFSYYSNAEFELAAKMLARNFRLNGLNPKKRIANLFVAGNLWSSFLAVEKAMMNCDVNQLSIGGLADKILIIEYLERFKPDFILGIPTLLVDLAMELKKKKKKIKLEGIFFAGEKFTSFGLALVEEVFLTKKIRSASYASVDAGPIGYQCEYCEEGEHHVFEDFVYLERVQGEAVVTTKYRSLQPILRLKTGDAISPIKLEQCKCGSLSPRFTLEGRSDNQINIWGCRIKLDQIEKSLKSESSVSQLQVVLKLTKKTELMVIRLESSKKIDEKKLLKKIYKSMNDVVATHSEAYFKERCVIELYSQDEIPRIKRTGKLKKILDQR